MRSHDPEMAKATATGTGALADIVEAVRGFPRHQAGEFRFPKRFFFRKLDLPMWELDDVSEFIHLEHTGRSYILQIRHR
jgi:hypothetical protein